MSTFSAVSFASNDLTIDQMYAKVLGAFMTTIFASLEPRSSELCVHLHTRYSNKWYIELYLPASLAPAPCAGVSTLLQAGIHTYIIPFEVI